MHGWHDGTILAATFGHVRAAQTVADALAGLAGRVPRASVGIAGLGPDGVRTRRTGDDRLLGAAEGEVPPGTVAVGRLAPAPSAAVHVGLEDPPAWPAVGRVDLERVVVAVAGHPVGLAGLADELAAGGAALPSDDASHVVLASLARSRQRTLVNRVVDALLRVEGAFAAVVATADQLVVGRDRHGLVPLVLGYVDDAVVAASDEAAILAAGGRVARELDAGEIVVVTSRGETSIRPFPRRPVSRCGVATVALASDAAVRGAPVWALRGDLGARLARTAPEADVVVAASPGATRLADALAGARGTRRVSPWLPARGRVALGEPVHGQEVLLVASGVDESLAADVAALLAAGADAVHVVAALGPPVRACPYGVVVPAVDEAPADRWAARLGAASVTWLDLPVLDAALRADGTGACLGCLGGAWPIEPAPGRDQLPLFTEG